MPRLLHFDRRTLAAGIRLAAPSLAAIALMVVFAALAWWVGALAAVAVLLGVIVMVMRDTHDRTTAIGYVEALTTAAEPASGDVAAPLAPLAPPTPPLVDEADSQAVVSAVMRHDRLWRSQLGRVAAERDHFADIVEALHDPLLQIDENRIVQRANAAAARLLGARLLNRDLAEVLRHPAVLDAVDEVLSGGRPETVEMVQPVPIERVFEVRVKPFVDGATGGDGEVAQLPMPDAPATAAGEEPGHGAPTAALLLLHDITGIKRSEQMRADFVANASHELRTPLSTLMGFLETLRGAAREDSAARERFLGIMQEQAARMARLIDDLLSLSRIELEEHTPPVGTVDVVAAAGAVVDTLELRARERGMSIALVVATPPPKVVGDEDQLTQVFQNLVVNALKYAAAETQVTVTIGTGTALGGRAGEVAIAVADRGEGIARNHLSRLTERFYRVDPGRSRAIGGTGLGLAIVKHIVNRHRGRLVIDSRVGQGSVFTVFLPVSLEETGALAALPVDGATRPTVGVDT